MRQGLFVVALFIVFLTILSGFSTKKDVVKLLLRIFRIAGIATNTSPGPR